MAENKVWGCRQYWSDRKEVFKGILFSWICAPVDHLWLELQYVDPRHSAVIDLQRPGHNPFEKTFNQLSDMMLTPAGAGPLKTVYNHYEFDESDALWSVNLATLTIANLVCQIHWRFRIKFSCWPWPLAALADVCVAETAKRDLATKFWQEPPCCLDEYFGLKLQRLLTCEQDLVDLRWLGKRFPCGHAIRSWRICMWRGCSRFVRQAQARNTLPSRSL